MAKIPNSALIGQKFGRLFAVSVGDRKGHSTYINCKCECGQKKSVSKYNLFYGEVRSCGCLQRDQNSNGGSQFDHGYKPQQGYRPEYNAWVKIKERCYNVRSKSYLHYGGRGITVCERWRNSFVNFIADMGDRPVNCSSIGRIDNNGNYEPSNCEWQNSHEQSRNKRNNVFFEFAGKRMVLKDWATEYSISHKVLWYRINKGWGFEKALTTPVLNPHLPPSP